MYPVVVCTTTRCPVWALREKWLPLLRWAQTY